MPSFLFYLSGTVVWTYFSNCLTRTSDTFIANAAILGKVYFPRLVMPVATVLSKLIDFAIQYSFFLVFLVIYMATGARISPNWLILLTPLFDFGSALMEGICIGYAFVISCMVGKTFANLLRERNTVTVLLVIGSCLFYFSDLMLVLCAFGGGPKITDTLCIYTYIPAQCLLAHSVFHFVNKEN